MPLTHADCPLLAADSPLPGLFNDLLVAVDEVETYRAALDESELARARSAVADGRELLTRDRYRVGFLGGSQFGKTKTLNNVVQVTLGTGGGSAAATSTVSRFRPCDPSAEPTLVLAHMSVTQYQQRRWALADRLGLSTGCPKPDPQKTPAELAAESAPLLAAAAKQEADARMAAATGGKLDSQETDRGTLVKLLQACAGHGRHLRPDRASLPPPQLVRFSHQPGAMPDLSPELRAYTNHQSHTGGHPNDLLWQVQVDFPTPHAKNTLELIDLPGLGTTREADDLTTLAFMDQLDGALVFFQARQAQEGTVGKILNALHGVPDLRWPWAKPRESLKGRVWVVVTYMEQLSQEQLGLTGGEQWLFSSFAAMLKTYGISQSQLLFVGNLYAEKLAKRKLQGRVPTADFYEENLGLNTDDAGRPVLPDRFHDPQYAGLKAAYDEFVADGGVERARRVIGSDLAEAVARLTERHAALSLSKAAGDLSRHLSDMAQFSGFSEADVLAARRWETAARQLSGEAVEGGVADPDRRALPNKATELFTAVKRTLRRKFADLSTQATRDLRGQHQVDSEALINHGRRLAPPAVRELFDWAAGRLPELVRNSTPSLARISVDGVAPDESLRQGVTEDLADAGWCTAPFDGLADPVFFPPDAPGNKPLPFADYRLIMLRKLDAACHAVAHEAVRRVVNRLTELQRRLNTLAGGSAEKPRPKVDPALLRTAAGRLQHVGQRLAAAAPASTV